MKTRPFKKLVRAIENKDLSEVECYIYDFVDNCLQIYIPKVWR